jgi:tetratricopeptide (TPR) repeat protein
LYGCGADPKAAGQRAAREYAAHDYAAAQTDLATALSVTPDDPGLLELHAHNALALGNGEAAASSLDKLARSPHAPADMQKLVAEADLQRGLPDRTLADLGQATDPASQRLRALALLAKKDRAGASKQSPQLWRKPPMIRAFWRLPPRWTFRMAISMWRAAKSMPRCEAEAISSRS